MSSDGFSKKVLRLCKQALFRALPEKLFLQMEYRLVFGKPLDMKNPRSFSEKIYSLRRINRDLYSPIIRMCYDKIKVRDYVADKLGQEEAGRVLNEVYAIYEQPEDIEFDSLPDSFVLKVSQSSGYNVICPDKSKLNVDRAVSQLRRWQALSKEAYNASIESYAFDGHPKISCERFLSFDNGEIPPDIRVYCFNGKPRLFVCDFETTTKEGAHGEHIKRNVYDLDWNLLDVDLGRPHDSSIGMEKPDNLDDIVCIASKLAEDFLFVRVDLYNMNGRIVFGELTWIPMGGKCVISPESFDCKMGSWLDISDATVENLSVKLGLRNE